MGKNDNAFDEHQRFFPDCPRVKLGPLIEIASDGPTGCIRDLGIQQISPPRKPKYSSLDARLRTYSRWPISEIQKPEILAQAGFYYQQIDDQVRCFHCNGGLRSWQKEDDPWFEHAKWFPLCQFLKLVKGQTYINQVQEIGRNTTTAAASGAAAAITTNGNHGNDTVEYHDISGHGGGAMRVEQQPVATTTTMTLDEAMVTEPVRQALEMGLNEGRIRSATKRHLDYNGKPFDTTEELVEAVLEGQVNEEEDGSNDLSSSIVREVSRILNNIFNPRNRLNSDNFDDSTSSLTEDEDNPSNATAVYYHHNSVPSSQRMITTGASGSDDDFHSVPDINCGYVIQSSSQQTTASSTNSNQATTNCASNSIAGATAINNTTSSTSNPSYSSVVQQQQQIPTTPITPIQDIDLKKQLSLEEENRKLKDARLCKVCMDEEVGVVFLPCGHLVTCVQCAPGVNACPLCRSAIKGLVRTFLS